MAASGAGGVVVQVALSAGRLVAIDTNKSVVFSEEDGKMSDALFSHFRISKICSCVCLIECRYSMV